MPMNWTAPETDAKLLAAIISVYDLKLSGAKLEEIANIMGEGCTAKALMHRIGKIRVLASGRDGGKGKVKGKEGSGRKGGAGARVGGTEEEDSGGAGAANGGRSKKRKVGDEGRDVKEESAPVEAEINGGEGSGEDF